MHLRKIYGEVSQQSPISEKDIQRPNRRLKAQEVQPKYVNGWWSYPTAQL